MNPLLLGGILGAVGATGLLMAILATPPMRRPTLSDRIAPYLTDAGRPSRLLTGSSGDGPTGALGKLTAPLVRDAGRFVDRIMGGRGSVERRLSAIGSPISVDQFRTEQVLWGSLGAAIGAGIGVLAVVLGQSNPFILLLLIVVSAAAGVLGRDWWLTQAVGKQEEEIIAEFPVIAEMLALSVTAGESPMGAIDRVTKLAHARCRRALKRRKAPRPAGPGNGQDRRGAGDYTPGSTGHRGMQWGTQPWVGWSRSA